MENNLIVGKLTEKFGDKVQKLELHPPQAAVVVKASALNELAAFIKEDQDLAIDYIMSISGVDLLENGMEIIYHFCSTTLNHRLTVKVKLDREKPEVPTIIEQFPGANWYEREAWELFGINIKGHPKLERFLLAEDWDEGFPMRKDWDQGKDFVKMPEF